MLVVAAIRLSILRSCCINSDDTGILVQDKTQQGGSKKSFLWVYVGDQGEVVFDFTAGRTRDGPLNCKRPTERHSCGLTA
jgi:hypothetical protein